MDPARRRLCEVAATQVGRHGATLHGHPVRSTDNCCRGHQPTDRYWSPPRAALSQRVRRPLLIRLGLTDRQR